MFVGETGIGRMIKRTLEMMKVLGTDEPERLRKAGVIDLSTIQRYMNFWFSSSLDLFGADVSSNAASYFATGLKGRPDEAKYDDHVLTDAVFKLEKPSEDGARLEHEEVPMRNAINEVTRQSYVQDCQLGVTRWNRLIKKAGFDFELSLPSERFRRQIGSWAGFHFTPEGKSVSVDEWQRRQGEWIPSENDRAFIRSLMHQVIEPGKVANWIAPPDRGINNLPVAYEYVRLD